MVQIKITQLAALTKKEKKSDFLERKKLGVQSPLALSEGVAATREQ